MADRSREGRRYSDKPKKKVEEKPKKKPVYRSHQPRRPIDDRSANPPKRTPGDVSKVKKRGPSKAHETDNGPRKVPYKAPAPPIEIVPRWLQFHRQEDLENVQKRRFPQDRGPRLPIDDRSANPPERRPHPMIEPLNNTLLPQQLRSQAAHNYGFTPEAYKEMRQVP